MVSSHVCNTSVLELVKITHVIGKLLSDESTVMTQWREHSVLDCVSMCVRNLSERVLFSERDELIRSLNEGIKINNNVNKVKLFTKNLE